MSKIWYLVIAYYKIFKNNVKLNIIAKNILYNYITS